MKDLFILLFIIVTVYSSDGNKLNTMECQTICNYMITAPSSSNPKPCHAAVILQKDGKSSQCTGNYSVTTGK